MTKTWAPSAWGRILTGSPDWLLRVEGSEVVLTIAGEPFRRTADLVTVSQGSLWADITFAPGVKSRHQKVDGLPNREVEALLSVLLIARAAHLSQSLKTINAWCDDVSATIKRSKVERLWITHETQQSFHGSRPPVDSKKLRMSLLDPNLRRLLMGELHKIEKNLSLWESDWPSTWATLNEEHVVRELTASKDLFDRVESRPLTEEQARAVICFDNRVQVVASAGSGKTSTMVAKAAYAIQRGLVEPERIILLAFNKKAAEELKERAALAFERLGMEGITVEASTFHKLGLGSIGKATGAKPQIPDWATDAVGGFHKISEIIDQLKDESPAYRTQWDMFRLVFSRDLPKFGAPPTSDVWDKNGNGRTLTLDGKRVRSMEEANIANWLFYNGVNYEYEVRYEFSKPDADHGHYNPDFFYRDIRLYHEHFALNNNGEAPAHFAPGYVEGAQWKREEHKRRGTDLIETTSHQIRTHEAFTHLSQELTRRGVILDPNPDRPIPIGGQKPMSNVDLAGLIRVFIGHAKSNCLSPNALRARLKATPETADKARYGLFLELVFPILKAWDAALAEEDGVDFEDMLNMAAEHLETGRYESPYDLVMADEFQDASRSRARLCRALVQEPGRFFFAVGDDWQSINRFAGADVSVMTGFKEWIGNGQVLRLEQTFRCPQKLCDVSSKFITKNPAQIKKSVRSITPAIGPVLVAFSVPDRDRLKDAVANYLDQLCEDLQNGTIPAPKGGKVSVAVLGRYKAEQAYVPDRWKARYGSWIDLTFLTVHRSKGSEADYIILPAMVSHARKLSFPSTRNDDPVLSLAMPNSDNFPLGEERRLFYVALTRARRTVAMFTVTGQRSDFLKELEEEGALSITDTDGEPMKEQKCPACLTGAIVTKNGAYGEFEGCSNYPACEFKPKQRSRMSVAAPTSGVLDPLQVSLLAAMSKRGR